MKYPAPANLKTGLFAAGLILIAAVLMFSFRLVDQIRDTTRRHLTVTVERYSELLKAEDPTPALQVIQKIDFPLILADEHGEPLFWKNMPIASDNHSEIAIAKLKQFIKDFDAEGNRPIPLEFGSNIHYFHYHDETLIRQLRIMTWLGICAAIMLVFIGYTGFSSVRAAEERAMWIGIARETAHQFGTPVSGLMGWLELLQSHYPEEPALREMDNDIQRLRNVLARFSAIGKDQKLIVADLSATVRDAVDYMRKRLPQKARNITVECTAGDPVMVTMRPELIDWVLENLLRNAAEAIDRGDGLIVVAVTSERNRGIVLVTDNGKGMTKKERRNAFRAGFSTKNKGWGVGLSLAKRIVEEEHHGTLAVSATSRAGTTFRLELPLAKENHL